MSTYSYVLVAFVLFLQRRLTIVASIIQVNDSLLPHVHVFFIVLSISYTKIWLCG
jgi:hypothetical protein